ncbi:thiol-disulfide oxidoreductase DCC family protein [Nannocystis punicea]|uniref:DUF393 domain-containing protein n=1 Tax=Nannocystis punicea TaxID=2995304 RepID=A0ABY7GX03_9BACT|nr:DUF393 domain-containing protein [Nannocystis poenicansa]WAS91457.1 DUF393 domain-containing protein [Nannocystis poenicansa]
METLSVLYDAECGLCSTVRRFLEQQPAYVPLHFIPLQHPDLAQMFPGIEAYRPDQELLVIRSTGEVYVGGGAWLMCLWALADYREWSVRLATPALLPLVRRFCTLVSSNRLSLSSLLRLASDAQLARLITTPPAQRCAGNTCPSGCLSE